MYEIGIEEINEITELINSRNFFRYKLNAPSVCQEFEEEVAQKLGVKYALLVTSGTNALVCAMASLGIGPGDEVIIPSYTFVATSLAVTIVGAIPIIVNVDSSLGISKTEIEKAISERTKAIIPVHMDGLATDMDTVVEIAKEKNLYVIEDTAQAFGGMYGGKRLGTIGDAGCYSFNCDKIITAGEGGLVVTNDRTLYERMFCMMDGSGAFNPCNKDLFEKIKPFLGMSMRVSNLMAGILRAQLRRLDNILINLSERKEIFVRELTNINGLTIIRGSDSAGDCCTILHLKFSDAEVASRVGKELRENMILAYPPTMQPAHVCWKYTKNLGKNFEGHHPAVNPYNYSDKKYSYGMAKYLDSVDLVMSCLKYNIEYDLSIDDTVKKAQQMASIIAAVL